MMSGKLLVKQECLQLSPEGSDRRCRLHIIWQTVPENGGCDRKRATAGCWQTVLRYMQLQRERRPQTAKTWQAWYWNELIQIRWRDWCHTVQHSVCRERQFKVAPFWWNSQDEEVFFSVLIPLIHRNNVTTSAEKLQRQNTIDACQWRQTVAAVNRGVFGGPCPFLTCGVRSHRAQPEYDGVRTAPFDDSDPQQSLRLQTETDRKLFVYVDFKL